MPEFKAGDGVRIHYEVEGREDGPPLLFSHSLGPNLGIWDAQAKEAAGLGFRVICYDARGHGRSQAPAGDYTIPRLGQDALDLLDALQIARAAFCGISMGAMTGIWLAMHHPRRISRAAFCNTAVWAPPRELWQERIEAVRRGGMAAVADKIVGRSFTAEFIQTHPEAAQRLRDMILATDPVGYAGGCAAVRDLDLRDRLGLIEAPALVVIGAHDVSTPPERGQYIVERIPGAQKALFDAAHLSNIEKPDDFNRVVLGFLAGERR